MVVRSEEALDDHRISKGWLMLQMVYEGGYLSLSELPKYCHTLILAVTGAVQYTKSCVVPTYVPSRLLYCPDFCTVPTCV